MIKKTRKLSHDEKIVEKGNNLQKRAKWRRFGHVCHQQTNTNRTTR